MPWARYASIKVVRCGFSSGYCSLASLYGLADYAVECFRSCSAISWLEGCWVVDELGVARIRVRVGRRFTVTIPKEVRERLGIREGDELDLIVAGDSIILRKPLSLVEFIDSIEPRGSVREFLEERVREVVAEGERTEELAK